MKVFFFYEVSQRRSSERKVRIREICALAEDAATALKHACAQVYDTDSRIVPKKVIEKNTAWHGESWYLSRENAEKAYNSSDAHIPRHHARYGEFDPKEEESSD